MNSEKLDMLMKITDTKNSTLGRALSFDPSYIGRIRTGKRGIPKHLPFIEPAAAFFSKNIKTDYQKKLVSEIVCGGKQIPEDKNELEKLICLWLSDDNNHKTNSNSMTLLLHKLSSATPAIAASNVSDADQMYASYVDSSETPYYFFGNSGKREAAEIFLNRLCADNKPHTLLLFSDEDMTWLYEESAFTKRWATSLIKLLSTGSHIKIVHTINRNLNDLMEAIQKWLPLYMAGDIEPYYYPRIRDGVFHRTLFIAEDNFAITSNSIGSSTKGMPNFFIEEKTVLKGLEKEFYNFLSLCVPLMKIHKRSTKGIIPLLIKRFKKSQSEIYFISASSADVEKEKDNSLNDLINFTEKNTNVIKLTDKERKVPENITILTGINSGVVVITDKLIFDTTQPDFTITFLEYLLNL